MPVFLSAMGVVNDPTDSNAAIISGGYDGINGQFSDAILRLKCNEECNWSFMTKKLRIPRHDHVSFMMKRHFNCTLP